MIKQKEAVFAAYQAGINNGLAHGSDELYEFVASNVQAGIVDGSVEYSKDRADEKAVKSYSRSLTANWFKKDERISGAKYVPATKRGPQVKDEQLRSLMTNLKALKAHNADMGLISRVEKTIEDRRRELQSQKSQSKVQSMDETLASLQQLGIEV